MSVVAVAVAAMVVACCENNVAVVAFGMDAAAVQWLSRGFYTLYAVAESIVVAAAVVD